MRQVFIPLTLDDSQKQRITTKQWLVLVFTGIITGIIQVGILIVLFDNPYSKISDWYILLPLEVAMYYVATFIIRKAVIHEKRLIRSIDDSDRLQQTKLTFIWNIFTVNNNRVYWEDGRVGVIIRLKHGYIYNRPPTHEQMHREQCQEALAFLLRSGYFVSYYNREVQDSNLEPLEGTKANVEAFKGTDIYPTMHGMLQHITKVCSKVAFSEEEFYLIVASNQHTIEAIDKAVRQFKLLLQGSLYLECEQLNDSQLMEFPMNLFGIQFIDKDKIAEGKISDSKLTCLTVEKITYDYESGSFKDDDLI